MITAASYLALLLDRQAAHEAAHPTPQGLPAPELDWFIEAGDDALVDARTLIEAAP
jgi:hypothetical protein